MRKNRGRVDTDIPLLTDAIEATPSQLGAPTAGIPLLTDRVEAAAVTVSPMVSQPAAGSSVFEGDPSDWLVMDTIDPALHSITGEAPDTLAVVPPVTLKVPDPVSVTRTAIGRTVDRVRRARPRDAQGCGLRADAAAGNVQCVRTGAPATAGPGNCAATAGPGTCAATAGLELAPPRRCRKFRRYPRLSKQKQLRPRRCARSRSMRLIPCGRPLPMSVGARWPSKSRCRCCNTSTCLPTPA